MSAIADESLDTYSVEEGEQSNHDHSARYRFLKSSSSSIGSELQLGSPVPGSPTETDGKRAINDERRPLIKPSTRARGHVPLSIFLCLFGLHNPHRHGRYLWSGVLIFLFSFGALMQVLINFFCLVFDSDRCPDGAYNMSVLQSNQKSLLFLATVWQFLAPLATYAAAVWCVHKALRAADALHPSLTRILTSGDNWKGINRRIAIMVIFIFTWFGVACYKTYEVIFEKAREDRHVILGFIDGFNLVILGAGLLANHAAMFMFNAVICALIGCVDQMRQQLLEFGLQNINEAIIVFSDLSKVIRATSKVFGVWFFLQWFIYGLTIVWNSPLIQAQFSLPLYPIWTKQSLALLTTINHSLFIFPVIIAASLDARCKEMVKEVNDMVSSEWPAEHVLKDRSQLELFLSHAQRSDLAFMMGPMPIRMAHALASVGFSFVLASVNIAYQNY